MAHKQTSPASKATRTESTRQNWFIYKPESHISRVHYVMYRRTLFGAFSAYIHHPSGWKYPILNSVSFRIGIQPKEREPTLSRLQDSVNYFKVYISRTHTPYWFSSWGLVDYSRIMYVARTVKSTLVCLM